MYLPYASSEASLNLMVLYHALIDAVSEYLIITEAGIRKVFGVIKL